jgi:hypothetical protein
MLYTRVLKSFSWTFSGDIEEIIFEATLVKKDNVKDFKKDDDYVNGLQSHKVVMQENAALDQAKVRHWSRDTTSMYEPSETGSVIYIGKASGPYTSNGFQDLCDCFFWLPMLPISLLQQSITCQIPP